MSFPWVPEPVLADDPARDPHETAFLTSIIDDPDDDAARLVFADWLEENGRADKAAFVRLEVEMSRLPQTAPRYAAVRDELFRLDEAIGGRWTWALVRIGQLLNCGGLEPGDPAVRFSYECPNRWADLQATADREVRYCGECRKNVYRCGTKAEAEQHAVLGHCICITSRLALAVRREYQPPPEPTPPADPAGEEGWAELLGMPVLPPSAYQLWADELFARHRKRWWQFWKS